MRLARWQQWPTSAVNRQGGWFVFNDENCSFSVVRGHVYAEGNGCPQMLSLDRAGLPWCSLSQPLAGAVPEVQPRGWEMAVGCPRAAPGMEKTSMRLRLPWDSRALGAPMIRPLQWQLWSHVLPSSFFLSCALCSAFHSLSIGAHKLSVTHAPFVPRECISRHNGTRLNSIPSVLKT